MAFANGAVRSRRPARPLAGASRRAGQLVLPAVSPGGAPVVAGSWDELLAVLGAAGSTAAVHVAARGEMSVEEISAWLTLLRRAYGLALRLRRAG